MSMSKFASTADYWKDRAERAERQIRSRVELLGPEPEEARPVAEFHAHPADWQYSITLLPGVPMLPDGTKLYAAPLARPVAPAGWFPMETAPKDGTKILLNWESGVVVGWYEKRTSLTLRSPWRRDLFGLRDTTEGAEPTHWMPLPAAPGSSPAAPAPVALEAPAELRGLDTSTRVRFYEHEFYVLSNFSAFNLQWSGRTFQTSEHAYHWEKFTDPDGALADVRAIQRAIFNAPSAHEAFKIAERNRVHRRPDWDDVKVGIMREILREKAQQHEYVRRKLLETGDRELVEDSWRDDFWGWGPNRDGQNMLGRLWMEVRAELRAHGITAPSAAEG